MSKSGLVYWTHLVAAGLALVIMTPAEASRELRMAYEATIEDTQHEAAMHFKHEVESRTDGELEIRLYPDGQLGDTNSLISRVRDGSIDLELSSTLNYSVYYAQLSVLDVPYLFSSMDDVCAVLDGAFGDSLLAGLDNIGLKGLAFWDEGFRMFSNDRHPIKRAADLTGLVMRVPFSLTSSVVLKTLGAHPVQLPHINLYTAIQRGYIQGQDLPIGRFYSSRIYKLQPYLSLTHHQYTPLLLCMNHRSFEKLSSEEQTIITEAAIHARDVQRDLNRKRYQDTLQKLRDQGVTIEENIDIKSFQDTLRVPVLQYMRASGNSQLLEEISRILIHRDDGAAAQP